MNDKNKKLSELLFKTQKNTADDNVRTGFLQRLQDFLIEKSTVPIKEKAYFFELLATMIRAGIPLNKALKILISKVEHARLRKIIAVLASELEHGRTLSQGMGKFPDVFKETELGVVRSGEAVGHLEQILFKLADNLWKQSNIIMNLKSALVYPLAVVAALLIGALVMTIFVIPKMRTVFAESSLSLPPTTRVLLATGEFIGNAWWFIAIILIFAAIVFHLYVNSTEGRFSWDFHKLRIPFIGSILRKIYVMRFVDTLGLLVESGLPINQSLEFTANSIGNEVYRVKTYEALGRIQEGQKLSASLADAPFLFPETVTNMLAVAEQSASLGDLSNQIGVHYQREIDYTLKNATTVLGPILILVIGVTVAFFALAILSPIFSLTQSVQ